MQCLLPSKLSASFPRHECVQRRKNIKGNERVPGRTNNIPKYIARANHLLPTAYSGVAGHVKKSVVTPDKLRLSAKVYAAHDKWRGRAAHFIGLQASLFTMLILMKRHTGTF